MSQIETVRVVLYEPFKSVAGKSLVEITVQGKITVAQVIVEVLKEHPLLGKVFSGSDQEKLSDVALLVVDGKVADQETEILPGQQLMILPPLSGG
ncbi:MoaD/ThiS family protein [Calderihabitans maritimus]|uniref:Molybdopterin converting factor subunit 1 n=1 Tax=Calderihabitans maritimus TaxID=1246530 RepID=A0A1Z5HVI3_9FIRM|nr:MoaD/ThiS family protein [Calderihabitans maritimus]GAW93549.1 molybdopterin converting factor subunit 1 [Calderihabitans maritimus]